MPASLDHISAATPMGANLVGGGATFRVWAPAASAVYVTGDFNAWQRSDDSLLTRDGSGYWGGFIPGAGEGQRYKFYVVGSGGEGFKRDPYSRDLTTPFPGDCVLRDPSFPWRDGSYVTPRYHDFVIYQLHVGTFEASGWPHRSGTFLDVVRRIEYLADLGVTAIQLLPVVEFPSMFSKGYNGTDFFSPEMDFMVPKDELAAYKVDIDRMLSQKGLPPSELEDIRDLNQLKMLVNLCHLYGLAVIFDVVYNHAGGEFDPESIYYFDRQPEGDHNRTQYFTDQGWAGGLVFAFWKREVRQFLIDNARFFIDEYHADGFRYDEVSVIVRSSAAGWSFCQDLTSTVRAVKPEALQHAEHWPVNTHITSSRSTGGAGFDTTLHDGLRDSVRRAVEQASFPGAHPVDMDSIAEQLRAPGFDRSWRAVQGVENHDIVYRDRGRRVPSLADGASPRSWYARSRSRVALGLILTAPGIPMLFMGQEFLEDKPWSDDLDSHDDLLIWWAGLEGGDRHMSDFHRFTREAIRLRHRQPALRAEGVRVFCVHNRDRLLAFHRWEPGVGRDVVVVACLGDTTRHGYELGFPGPGRWLEVFNSDVFDHWVNPAVAGNGGEVHAYGPAMHGFGHSAAITIPANGFVVFARDHGV